MANAYKRKLSGSTSGRPILITQTSTAGPANTIHTSVASIVDGTWDEIWLWAYNSHSSDVILTIEFGGQDTPDQNIKITIPFQAGLIPIIPGLILQNEYIVKAFAEVGSVVTLSGFVNSITD